MRLVSVLGCVGPSAARRPSSASAKSGSASASLPCALSSAARLLTDASVSACAPPRTRAPAGERLAQERLGLGELALVLEQPREVVERRERARVRAAELLAAAAERLAVERLGDLELALRLEHEREVVDRRERVEVRGIASRRRRPCSASR